MPLYGITKYGTPRHYGYDGIPTVIGDQRAIVGGQAPWMDPFTIPWREASVAVWSVDPDTLDLDTQLPAVGVGSGRAATLTDDRYQEETLTLVLNRIDDYLPGGILHDLIALNALLRVVWTVMSPGGTLTWQSPLYSVQSSPSRDDDVLGGQPITVTAIDTTTVFRRTPASASGYLTTDPSTPATFDPTWFARFVWPPDQGPVPVATPGNAASWQDVFDFLWPWHPFRQVFDQDGAAAVREGGWIRTDGGWVVSRDPDVGGLLAVPWESLTRNVRDAAFTRVEYHWIQDLPADQVTPGGHFYTDAVGTATSQSSVNPHRVTPLPHINRVFDRAVLGVGAHTPAQLDGLDVYAGYLLERELGAADTVTLAVDSAFPALELGRLVRVCDEPRANGWYQLTGVSQPFSEGPASWTLAWCSDV